MVKNTLGAHIRCMYTIPGQLEIQGDICRQNDDDHFDIALFSALGQTLCTFVACDSERVTAAFYSAF